MIFNFLKNLYKMIEKLGSIILFEKYFRNRQFRIIQQFSENTNSILELGVGTNSYFHKENRKYSITGFDIFEKSLLKAKNNGAIDNYIVGNVNNLMSYFKEKSFDLVCAFDLIEHLSKEKGYELIGNMERIAKKKIIIYTPNGFQPQPPRKDNPFQEHLSGWDYWEMKKLGYNIIGFNGLKKLRGLYALPKYRPYFFFGFFSFISEILLQKTGHNELQYAILCYKEISK